VQRIDLPLALVQVQTAPRDIRIRAATNYVKDPSEIEAFSV
jgi:hypothetical protein